MPAERRRGEQPIDEFRLLVRVAALEIIVHLRQRRHAAVEIERQAAAGWRHRRPGSGSDLLLPQAGVDVMIDRLFDRLPAGGFGPD